MGEELGGNGEERLTFWLLAAASVAAAAPTAATTAAAADAANVGEKKRSICPLFLLGMLFLLLLELVFVLVFDAGESA